MVLVTGASGHLGVNLISLLLDQGVAVRALLFPGEHPAGLDSVPVERFEGDVLSKSRMREAVDGVDTVFHLAGVIGIRSGSDDLMMRVNVEGTRNVALASREAGVRRFVYVSSIHAFERPEDGKPIHEGLSFDPENPAGAYDRTKALATLEVLELAKHGLPAVVVCPTGIIGPNDYLGSEMGRAITTWSKPRRHLLIEGMFDFVDVRDVARGLIEAAEHGRIGECYILGGTRISLDRLRELVQEEAGLHLKRIRISWRLARFGATVLAPFYRLVGKRSPYTRYSIETVRSNSLVRTDRAANELDHRPRPIAETIRDTVAWLKAHAWSTSAWAGRVALVTGASSGIGEAIAKRLADRGLRVVLLARRLDRLERLEAEIVKRGGWATSVVCDLADPADVERAVATIERRFGGVDVLVNNAGVGWYGYFAEMHPQTIDTMLSVNTRAVVGLTRSVLPGMTARRFGRIINIGSIAGIISAQGTTMYSAGKAFLDSFSRSLSRELLGSGVRVTVVRPGPVVSEFFAKAREGTGRLRVPAERLGISPLVVARRVEKLLSGRRKVAYVPRVLSVLPLLIALGSWILDLAGPLHLRRRGEA